MVYAKPAGALALPARSTTIARTVRDDVIAIGWVVADVAVGADPSVV